MKDPFKHLMTDFPTLSYTSTHEIPNPFIYLKREKGTPFGQEGLHFCIRSMFSITERDQT